MTNLVTDVAETVEEHPDSAAIAYEGTELSYEEFWERTGQFAQALENRGIGEGDRVGIYLPNLPQFVTAFYGTLRAGGIIVPMNPQYKAREISHMLGDSGAKAVVALADLVPNVLEVQDDTEVEQVISVGADVEGPPSSTTSSPTRRRASSTARTTTSRSSPTRRGPPARQRASSSRITTSAGRRERTRTSLQAGFRPPTGSSAPCHCFTSTACPSS